MKPGRRWSRITPIRWRCATTSCASWRRMSRCCPVATISSSTARTRLLEGALRSGVPLNYGCSGGNCGLCKAKIVSGQVKKTRHHDFVLSEAEKIQGYVLLCSNTAVTDVEIEAPVAGGVQDIPFQEIAAKVKSITLLNQDVALLHPADAALETVALSGRAICDPDAGQVIHGRAADRQLPVRRAQLSCSMCAACRETCSRIISSNGSRPMRLSTSKGPRASSSCRKRSRDRSTSSPSTPVSRRSRA